MAQDFTSQATTFIEYLNANNPQRSMDMVKFYISLVDGSGAKQQIPVGADGVETAEEIVLYVNPASASYNFAKIVNRTQTMTGWLEEHWGEELDVITFQGSSASFLDVTNTGVRRYTASYIQMKQWLQYMYTNGMKFDGTGMASDRLFVRMYHDYGLYKGYFESFDLTEESASPFRFTYTVTFKSQQTVFNYLS